MALRRLRPRITLNNPEFFFPRRRPGLWNWVKALFGYPRRRMMINGLVIDVGPMLKDGSVKVYKPKD